MAHRRRIRFTRGATACVVGSLVSLAGLAGGCTSFTRDSDSGDAANGAPDTDASSEQVDAGAADDGDADASGAPDATIDATDDGDLSDASGSSDSHALDASDAGTSLLATAGTFGVLAGSSVTITATPKSTLIGDVGVSPGAAIATFAPGQPMGAVHANDAVAIQAQIDLTSAYDTLASTNCQTMLPRAELGGMTLDAGVYCLGSASASIDGTLLLDAKNDADATWIFQVGTKLTTGTGAVVRVINGGSACNVYWQLGTSATLGTSTTFAGTIVAMESITAVTSTTIFTGRALARNGFVSLDANTISAAACQ